MSLRRTLARSLIRAEGTALRGRIRVRAALLGSGFQRFGRGARLHPHVRVTAPDRVAVGDGVWIGAGAWLHVLAAPGAEPAIEIGAGCSLAGNCTIAAAQRVVLGREVLVARGVYIADHSHAFADRDVAVLKQGIDRIAPVVVEDGAWLAENAVICPGVTIGRGAVVGANAVVTRDVPPRSVVAGAPARVLRSLDTEAEQVAA